MGDKKIFIFLFIGIITGVIIVFQFNTDLPVSSNTPIHEFEARDALFSQIINEQSYLKNKIVTLRQQIEEKTISIDSYVETTNLTLLDGLKKEVGLTEITAPGLQVILNDGYEIVESDEINSNNHKIQASDLRDVVNILNVSNVDGISINNQRIIANTTISSVGNTILINNSHIAPPFNISVIGYSQSTIDNLKNKELLPSLYDKYLNKGVQFEIFKKNNITIPIYNSDLKVNFLNLSETL